MLENIDPSAACYLLRVNCYTIILILRTVAYGKKLFYIIMHCDNYVCNNTP